MSFARSAEELQNCAHYVRNVLQTACNILGIDERIFIKFGTRTFTIAFRDVTTLVEVGQTFLCESQAQLAKYLSEGKIFLTKATEKNRTHI